MVIYSSRPNDGSRRAWDYITKVYGEIEEMQFNPNCCGPQHWVGKLKNGKFVCIDSEELHNKRNII